MKKVEIKNLNKSYFLGDTEYKVLKDLNVSFNSGEFVAIYGESGSGKSTLMNVVGGLDIFQSGEILIEGESIQKFTNKSMDYYRNRKIGFIFQEFKLMENLSLLENVMMPMNISGVSEKEAKKRAKELLETVGLADHVKKPASNLSGGQKQRVAIARALANDPDIILADEPTGALDSSTSTEILQLLKEISDSGKLVIAITHSEEVAKYGNRVVTLEDGKIIENVGSEKQVEEHKVELSTKHDSSNLSIRKAFKIARANLFSKKVRTALVAIGVSLGITGAIVITSISEDAINDSASALSSFEIIEEHVALGAYSETEENPSNSELKKAIETFSSEYDGYVAVLPQYYIADGYIEESRGSEGGIEIEIEGEEDSDTTIEYENTSLNFSFLPVTTMYGSEKDVTLEYGKFPSNKFEVYLTGGSADIEILAKEMEVDDKIEFEDMASVDFVNENDLYREFEEFIEKEIIGNTFTMTDVNGDELEFTVSGSMKFADSQTSMNSGVAFLPYEFNKDYLEENSEKLLVSRYFVEFENAEYANTFVDNLGLMDEIESGYKDYKIFVNDFRAVSIFVENILTIVRNVFLILISVSLIVSVFMVNIIVYISTLERKVEIGTLRAIGAKKNNITTIFIGEGIMIGILAFLISVVASFLMILVVNTVLYATGASQVFFTVSLSIKWLFIIAALIIFIMFAASLLPARRASNQNPIDALREE